MSEAPAPQPVSTEPPASTVAQPQEQSLEQVYESFKVEQPAPQPQAQPQQQPAPQQAQPQPQLHVPDPALDPEGFRRYEAAKAQEANGLKTVLQTVAGKLTQWEQERLQEREEQDIKKAVGVLKEKNPDFDEDFLEVALGAKARKDPRLKQVWNNRQQNPKAWDAALKAYGNELAGQFTMRSDPQLTENQRAMKTSQQTMATAQPEPSKEEKMGKLQGSDFDREWERIKAG